MHTNAEAFYQAFGLPYQACRLLPVHMTAFCRDVYACRGRWGSGQYIWRVSCSASILCIQSARKPCMRTATPGSYAQLRTCRW